VSLKVLIFFWGCGVLTDWWQESQGSAAGWIFLVLSMSAWHFAVTQVSAAADTEEKQIEKRVSKMERNVVIFIG
jgi:hypothetical protein